MCYSIISWNLNGLNANFQKGTLFELLDKQNPEILCLQEIKCQDKKLTDFIGKIQGKYNYPYVYFNCAEKKGYSGTMVLSRVKPESIKYGMGIEKHDTEGRLITLEFEKYYLVTCYTPNSKPDLERLEYRIEEWEFNLRRYLGNLDKQIIYCGDLNVAHNEIDLYHPKANKTSAGFTLHEREALQQMLICNNLVDSFRHFYPEQTGAYTWWSNFRKCRDRNVGWRIDYFLVSKSLMENLEDSQILPDYLGSDHCPIKIILKIDGTN